MDCRIASLRDGPAMTRLSHAAARRLFPFPDLSMTRIHPAWLAREERRWLRPDAHRWWRPDHGRFEKPNRFERKYSPDQPRVPAGNPDGGQWTSGSSGSSLASESFDGASFAEGTDAEPGFDSTESPVRLAYLGPAFHTGRVIVQAGIEATLGLYAALSAQNGPDRTAVAVFRATDFEPGADPRSPVSLVGSLTREEVDQVCPAQQLVQDLTDKAAVSFNRADYGASGYGTAVHMKVRDDIEAFHNPRLLAEVSYLKTLVETGSEPSESVYYGKRGSIRVDVLEKASNYTVCVYDIKTGSRILGLSRMREIAQTVSNNFPGTLRIVVTETRPRR
jgi:hypothetical protein